MENASKPDAAVSFDPLRARLQRVAYRMLGSMADAEDAVQEAYVRWHATDRELVCDVEGFLIRIVTRLCLDVLKSARRKRETYVGPWLPEPVFDSEDELDTVTLPLMLALERLSPLERAAFLLHDVFGVEFDEIGETIGRDAARCRQLASRARTHVREARPRYPIPKEQMLQLAAAFFDASRNGDMQGLQALLAADVTVHSDGGGKKPAAMRPIVGFDAVVQLHAKLTRVFAQHMSKLLRYGFIDGLPGFVTMEGDDTLQTTALLIEQGKIKTIYITRNPDKLQHLGL